MGTSTTHQLLSLALEHHQCGRLREAESVCRQILSGEADQPDAFHLLGLIAHQRGNNKAARDLIERAIAIEPLADYYCTLGLVFAAEGGHDEAIAAYNQALEKRPDRFDAWANLGNALKMKGKLPEAIDAYERAATQRPDVAAVQNNLAVALKDAGRHAEAVPRFEAAARLWPDAPGIWSNLGNVLKEMGRLTESKAAYRKAIELQPDQASPWNNLGAVHQDAGELDEAIDCFRKSMSLQPESPVAHANLLYLMHFHPKFDAQAIYQEHVRWNQHHAGALKRLIRPHANDRSPERRLRIGYVSPDFREHVVGRFMLPLFEKHDRQQFEIFCYSGSMRLPDFVTERLRRHATGWRTIGGLSDDSVAQMIREDRIDILVDLTMHLNGSRATTFARKPAPVQVTYLAYCSTTGLETIDYRITDPYFDPPKQSDEGRYSEKSIRIESYWCYQPIIELDEPSPPPALTNGSITFGCFNNFAKVSQAALEAWCRLLQEIPTSRLLLHACEGAHRERAHAIVVGRGVDPQRVSFVGPAPLDRYFQQYGRVDIALDPFPYAGGTTTCDALWMGVPVITLAGQTGVGRGGLSILSHVGLPELVASDVDQYIRIAAELASDPVRLAALRSGMRGRMRQSVLMNPDRFASNLELAYRGMWRTWCATPIR